MRKRISAVATSQQAQEPEAVTNAETNSVNIFKRGAYLICQKSQNLQKVS